MSMPSPRDGFSPERLFRRLDRAAAQLNPILMIITVGLLILNLIAVTAAVPHLQITRVQCASADPPGAGRAAEAGGTVRPSGGLN
jgi:hypothetical protein